MAIKPFIYICVLRTIINKLMFVYVFLRHKIKHKIAPTETVNNKNYENHAIFFNSNYKILLNENVTMSF